MSAGDLLRRLVALLDAAGVPHMVAGSFASTYHGVPRSTHDIDIVIDPSPGGLDALLSSLPEDQYYVDADVARDAFRRRSHFNLIDMETGWKVDLIVRKDRPFSAEEFGRRQPAELLGARVFVTTAEDTIVSKLEWAQLSGSERQLADAAGIVRARAEGLDRAYVERWVAALGLAAGWRRIQGG